MPILDDYVMVAGAGIVVASVIVLASFLARFRILVQEANKSTDLAKDLWDSVNSRFALLDGRIIDVMVKTDVLTSRLSGPVLVGGEEKAQQSSTASSVGTPPFLNPTAPPKQALAPASAVQGTETEFKVLSFLAAGSKSSAQIKDHLGKSREHTARLMKSLFDRGLVTRSDKTKPYVYELTEPGRAQVSS